MAAKPYRNGLTAKRLRQLLKYNPKTGIFRWRPNAGHHTRVPGKIAGGIGGRYWLISIDGLQYLAHRLAWLYVYGKWPRKGLDHRDLNPFNNRIGNLREADQGQNQANQRCRNSLGLKGVRKETRLQGGKFRAVISHKGKRYNLGRFKTPEEAHAAYCSKARELYGEFANDGRTA